MANSITFVGIDAHKEYLHVSIRYPEKQALDQFQIRNGRREIRRMARKIKKVASGAISACYEAGPCGYSLKRELDEAGIPCTVIAPSLIPVKPGERVKTDRKDARKLVELLKADMLTEVHPPTPEEEAVRDVCRARDSARDSLQRARHRMAKLLLRKGLRYTAGKKAWTQRYERWLRSLSFEIDADQVAFDHYLVALTQAQERLKAIQAKLEEIALEEPYAKPVAWLRCLRGIETVSAMTIVTELHDFRRFESPRDLMAYLGLVPSEHSSGSKEKRGGITKAGNRHVRRILVEAAWNYRSASRPSRAVQLRRTGQPGWVVSIAEKAQQRLHRRFWKLQLKGKHANKVATAIGRELAGFIWAILSDPRAMTFERRQER